jgi:hypothetical protein
MFFKVKDMDQNMELSRIFTKENRDVLFEILKHLGIYDIQKCFCLNKEIYQTIKNMIKEYYDQFVPIIRSRFLDKKAKLFEIEDVKIDCHCYSKTEINLWKKEFPEIDLGDLIYVKKKNIYLIVYQNKNDRYYIGNQRNKHRHVFPIDYWHVLGSKRNYVWISCYTDQKDILKDQRLVLMNEENQNFMLNYCSEGKIYLLSCEKL